MRRILCLGLLALFTMGCSGGQVISDPERDELIIKIAGRRIGAEIAQNYPEIAGEILRVDNLAIVDNNTVIATIELLVTSFVDNDPMLRADILDILAFVPIDPATEGYASVAMTVVNSIADGVKLYEGGQTQ